MCLILLFATTLQLYSAGNKDSKNTPSSVLPLKEESSKTLIENENPDESLSSENSTVLEENTTSTNMSEMVYVNAQKKFRLLEYDGEVLDITFNKEGSIGKEVLAQDTRVVIKTFDSLMRLTEIVEFSQNQDLNTLVSKTVFLYEEKSQYPSESTEIHYTKNKKIVCLFNRSGFAVSIKYYTGKYSLTSSQIEDDVLEKQERFKYTADNKLLEHEIKTDAEELLYLYNYEKDFTHPDIKTFRNTVLREEILYKDEHSYTKTTYFDEEQTIISFYTDDVKKEELFKSGNQVLRRRVY